MNSTSVLRRFAAYLFFLASILVVANPAVAGSSWQQGFDFRATAHFVTDPANTTYVLNTTAYPTSYNGTTYGWTNTSLIGAFNRTQLVDPRLAGINFAYNGTGKQGTFYVDLPSPGTYSIALAVGDVLQGQCRNQCQVQFLDGNTVLSTLTLGQITAGYFYDAMGNKWTSGSWPSKNVSQQVTLSGTRLTVVVGTTHQTGDATPISYLGLTLTGGTPNFAISASPASLTVTQGNQGNSTITTTTSGGFNSSISLSASGVPSGTTVSFNPNPIPAPGAGTSTMTISVGSGTPTGTYPITVTGSGGGVKQSTTVTLTVTAPPSFTISASPSSLTIGQGNQANSTITTTISGGFNSSIALSASGVPSGTTVSFNPNPIPAPGSGSSTMNVSVGSNTPTGTYPITVAGNGGGVQQTTTVTLTVSAAGGSFTISSSPLFLRVAQGGQGVASVTTTVNGGFNNPITLSVTGLPSDATATFNPNPIPAPGNGHSSMTVLVATDTPTGTYTLTVTGTGGGVKQSTLVTLIVSSSQPNFTITASPSSLSIVQGNQGNSTITTAISGGFNSAITLSATGMPSGTNVSFTPNPIPAPGSGSSTMTITVSTSTPTGTYPLTVSGNGGGIQQNTTVTLTVTSQQQPSFTISASPSSLSIPQGNQGISTLTTTISGGFNNSIALSASGVPSGTNVSFTPNPIPAPGSGTSIMTITVGASTATGTYPITVTGNGGGVQQNAVVTLTVTTQGSGGLDAYGGLTAAPVPGCNQTGFFQAIKVSGRWVFADPLCNAFYQLAVYDADYSYILSQIMTQRYNNNTALWATHTIERMQTYGLNSLDIYYSDYMLPVGTYGNKSGASIQIPFALFYAAVDDIWNHPTLLGLPESPKDLCKGQDSNGFSGGADYCGVTMDVFDPKYQQGNTAELTRTKGIYTGGFANDPWVTAVSLGDATYLDTLTGGGNLPVKYPHTGFIVATTNFQYTGYEDNTIYSKNTWINYLQNEYGTIAALNSAWGTGGFYTTFGDSGGFGTGTGVLDEDGRHTGWFGHDYYNLTGMNANLQADLNQFLYQFAYQAYSVQANTVRAYDPNHLFVCGSYGGSGDGGARPQVLQGMRDGGCNLFVWNWNSFYPQNALAANKAEYDATGVPAVIWYGLTAQADSDMSNYPKNGEFDGDYSSQLIRGQHYTSDLQAMFTAQGTNGDYYIMGISFWSLTDNSSEETNWGIMTLMDNVYDGTCAVIAQSTDKWGYPCGGESANYGDFLDSVSQANQSIMQQLTQQIQ